jgi:hypothetical protein
MIITARIIRNGMLLLSETNKCSKTNIMVWVELCQQANAIAVAKLRFVSTVPVPGG